jgi:hypothetical protein
VNLDLIGLIGQPSYTGSSRAAAPHSGVVRQPLEDRGRIYLLFDGRVARPHDDMAQILGTDLSRARFVLRMGEAQRLRSLHANATGRVEQAGRGG